MPFRTLNFPNKRLVKRIEDINNNQINRMGKSVIDHKY